MIDIHQFNCRADNFGVLVHDPRSERTISIDAPEQAAIEQALADTGWTLTDILVTHHHGDHVEAIEPLKAAYGVTVTATELEATKIPAVDRTVADGEMFQIGMVDVKAIHTPGHTLGHMCYWMPKEDVLFAGDTLFALGCGRVFEGTKEQMWGSLLRLRDLPDETRIYCGHEYTEANAKFARTIDPHNADLIARAKAIERLHAQGKATLPTTLAIEKATNPFLRADDPEIQDHLGQTGIEAVKVFANIREKKDRG